MRLTVVDVLQGRPAAVLHADPELVPPEVGAEVGHDVGVAAVLHHQDLLLDDAEVIPRLQLYHFNGSCLASGQPLGLKHDTLQFTLRPHNAALRRQTQEQVYKIMGRLCKLGFPASASGNNPHRRQKDILLDTAQ